MARIWLSTGSPTIEGMVNSFAAACDQDYAPTDVSYLADEDIMDDVEKAAEYCRDVAEGYDVDVSITIDELPAETAYEAIVDHFQSGAQAAADGDSVAIDITPGRKFMSALAFQAGIRFDVDHIFYFHRHGGTYRGRFYPEIPRTAATLVDFTEVI